MGDGANKVYGIPDFVVASHLGRLATRGANVVSPHKCSLLKHIDVIKKTGFNF